jgi:hypothetical protein
MSDAEKKDTGTEGSSVSYRHTPPLPSTVTDLLALRKSEKLRTLNDDVDDIHLRLWENPKYREYLWPIWREDTVEGSFIADDIQAASLIREYAKEHDIALASRAKLQSIVRSLHVVCRRFGITRKERQHLVNSEHVGFANDENNDGGSN